MKSNEKAYRGADKVQRYSWSVADKPGYLSFIDKNALYVDHSYQRVPKGDKRILDMASNWSWVACGTIVVSLRNDGSHWVLDGQHRVMAALKRSDIKQLPCIVFNDLDVTEEAKSYLRSNKYRRPLANLEAFKAQECYGEHTAVVVQELASIAGRKVGPTSDANSLRCVSCVSRHIRDNESAIRALWPVIVEVCKKRPLAEKIIDALMFIELRMPEGQSLASPRWRARIIDVGYDELIASMVKFSAAYAKGGARIWSLGALEAINKGLRNRLTVRGLDKEAA